MKDASVFDLILTHVNELFDSVMATVVDLFSIDEYQAATLFVQLRKTFKVNVELI